MIEGKVWGSTEVILREPVIEVHRLRIVPTARCSWHMHVAKWNAFMLISGSLIIERRKKEYDLIDRTVLSKGDLCTVPPGEYHRFVTEGCAAEAIEIYYPSVLGNDIVRDTVGGIGQESGHAKRRGKASDKRGIEQ